MTSNNNELVDRWSKGLILLKEFRSLFISLATVESIGDFPWDFWDFHPDMIENRKGVFQLKFLSGTGKLSCTFRSGFGMEEGDLRKWTHELVGRNKQQSNISEYEELLFSIWSYDIGQALDRRDSSEANWYIPDFATANRLEHIAERIDGIMNTILEHLDLCFGVGDVGSIVRNRKPKWCPGRISWSYVKELDEKIREFESELRSKRTERETKPVNDKADSMTSNDHYTEQEHRDFLRKIANEVYEFLRDPTKMARFRSQVNLFCEKNEAYQVEVQQLREASKADSEAQAAVKKLEKEKWGKTLDEMTEDEIAEIWPYEYPSSKGLPEEYKDYVYHFGSGFGFWGPPTKTVNLWFYLSTPIERAYLDMEKQWDTWRLEALKSSNDEKIISCYALLTAIHDHEIPEKPIYINKVYNGSWHLRDEWIDKLTLKCRGEIYPWEQDSHEGGKDMRTWIARAFDDVKADLTGIEKATVEHEVEPVKEAANLKMETVVDAKEDPVLQDLSKQLFNLDEVIVDLTNYIGRDPEHYVYDLNQTLEKILNVKKLATTLFNQLKLPQLRDLSILLVKLHRDVQYIHDELDFANSRVFDEIPGEEELNAKRAKEVEETADAVCDNILSNKLPELIEKYHIAVEEFAATFDVDSVIQVQGQAETDYKTMTGIEILQEQFKAAANKYPGLEHTLEDRLTEDCDPAVSSAAAERRMYKLVKRWNNKEKSVKHSPWSMFGLHRLSASGVLVNIRPANEKGYPKDHYLHRSPHQQWDARAAIDLFLLRAEEAGKLLIPLPELKGLWVTDPAEYWLLALHRVFPCLKLKDVCELTEYEIETAAGGSYLNSLHPRKGDEYFEVLDDVFAKSALLCGKLLEIVKDLPKDLPREPKADCTKNENRQQKPAGTMTNPNIQQFQLSVETYWSSLRDIATRVDSIIISENAKGLFQKHIDNVFREAEKYRKYINAEYEKARKKGLIEKPPKDTKAWWHINTELRDTVEYFIPESAWLSVWLDDGDHGTNRERYKAFWAYIAERDKLDKDSDEYAEAEAKFKRSAMGDIEEYLVPENDCDEMIVSFYMTRHPELDPLRYVFSMARGESYRQHENLTLLDYQYFIIACNHDCQRYAAGQPPVYFDPQKVASSREEFVDFKDRICGKVSKILENVPYLFLCNDSRAVRAIQTVQLTMKLALQAVKADCTKQAGTGPIAVVAGNGKPVKKKKCSHSPDYGEVTWDDTPYKFNKSQAIAVKLLWLAWEAPNKVGVSEKEIGAAVDSFASSFRLQDLFRMRIRGQRKYHDAWNTMIYHLGSGMYGLKLGN